MRRPVRRRKCGLFPESESVVWCGVETGKEDHEPGGFRKTGLRRMRRSRSANDQCSRPRADQRRDSRRRPRGLCDGRRSSGRVCAMAFIAKIDDCANSRAVVWHEPRQAPQRRARFRGRPEQRGTGSARLAGRCRRDTETGEWIAKPAGSSVKSHPGSERQRVHFGLDTKSCGQVFLGRFVEIDALVQRCSRRLKRAWTSSQGTSFALPSSRETMRRSISWRQACSTSASSAVSRLSRRKSAKAARASAGSSSASWRSCAASRGIRTAYLCSLQVWRPDGATR